MKKVIDSLIFLAMALSVANLALGARSLDSREEKVSGSRFLTEHSLRENSFFCRKQNETCSLLGQKEGTCCYRKCVDLKYDFHHCGACNNKCCLTEACCGGECVVLGSDSNHCGACNSKCKPGAECIYGMCDYA